MEKLELILGYISTSLIVLVAIVTYSLKLLSSLKEIKNLKNEDILENELMKLIKLAESLFTEGSERKYFVLSRIENFSSENKIKMNQVKIEQRIDEMITFTKNVNYKNESGEINGS